MVDRFQSYWLSVETTYFFHVKNKHCNIRTTEIRTKETTNTAMTSIERFPNICGV